MMTSYIKESRTAGNKLPHGNNHLSAPNTSIYGFKAGYFFHATFHMWLVMNEIKAAGKQNTTLCS